MSILRTFSSAASRPFFTPPITGVNGSNYWEKVKTFPSQISCHDFLWVNPENSILYGKADGNNNDLPTWTLLNNGDYTATTDAEFNPTVSTGIYSLNINRGRTVAVNCKNLEVNLTNDPSGSGTRTDSLRFLEFEAGQWSIAEQYTLTRKLFSDEFIYLSESGNSVIQFFTKPSFYGDPWMRVYRKLGNYWILITDGQPYIGGYGIIGTNGCISGDGNTIAFFRAYRFSVLKSNGTYTGGTISENWTESLGLDIGTIGAVYLNEDGTVFVAVTYTTSAGGSGWSNYQMTYRAYKFDGASWNLMGSSITVSATDFGSGTPTPRGQIINKDGNVLVVRADSSTTSRSIRVYKFDGTSWNLMGAAISGERIGSTIFLSESGSKITIAKDQAFVPLEQYQYIP